MAASKKIIEQADEGPHSHADSPRAKEGLDEEASAPQTPEAPEKCLISSKLSNSSLLAGPQEVGGVKVC